MNLIEKCPVCNQEKNKIFLESEDFSLSNEKFNVVECLTCNFLYTNPRPFEKNLGKYYINESYISHTDNKKGLFNFLYQNIRQYAIKTKTQLLIKSSQTKKHLDIGCGTGDFLNSCKNKNIECVGIEPSDIARNKGIEKYNLNIKKNTDLKQFEENSFQSVSMWHVLEHVYEPNQTILDLKKIITANGTLIIAVPNYESLDARIYKKYWAAWDLPIHLNHFSVKSITKLLNNHNFILDKKIGMKFDSFYVSLLSNEHKSGYKNYFKGFCIGLLSNVSAFLGLTQYSSTIYIFSNKK
jgi:2-polyprenyl-3-methyl-5-hydroxy-6-metoxy-1,4-benzoquinol methylase